MEEYLDPFKLLNPEKIRSVSVNHCLLTLVYENNSRVHFRFKKRQEVAAFLENLFPVPPKKKEAAVEAFVWN